MCENVTRACRVFLASRECEPTHNSANTQTPHAYVNSYMYHYKYRCPSFRRDPAPVIALMAAPAHSAASTLPEVGGTSAMTTTLIGSSDNVRATAGARPEV